MRFVRKGASCFLADPQRHDGAEGRPDGAPRGGKVDLASTNLLVTLIIGGIVGWLASIVMKTNAQMGIVANVIIGIIGSFLGVSVANALGVRAHTTPAAWIVAILGAALLIALLRALGVFNRTAAWR